VTQRYKLTLEYDGTDFHGWQVQPEIRTVQGELESALARLGGGPVRCEGAGRTDAGVHALGQVASFSLERTWTAERLLAALNGLLPADLRAVAAEPALPAFHARHSARWKAYLYLIEERPVATPIRRRYAHHVQRPLDLDAMRSAARWLLGIQDFASFCAGEDPGKPTVREMVSIELVRRDSVLRIRMVANGFLRAMARRVVGTLLEIGCGRLRPESSRSILLARDRAAAGATAPARGLFLERVVYDADWRGAGTPLAEVSPLAPLD